VSGRQVDVGIIIDGAGIGSAMTANKVPNVRAAACYSVALAKNSREHNGANILTLGAGQNSLEEMTAIVEAFLSADISEERHKKRVGKIEAVERQYIR
jgi:ribose 5-phosphate isomerase B